MAYLMKSGTERTVGSTAGKVSKPLPLHMRQPSRRYVPWASPSEQSTLNPDETDAQLYLNATAPQGCTARLLSPTDWHFIGPWSPAEIYASMMQYYRGNDAVSTGSVRTAAITIGAHLEDHGDSMYRVPTRRGMRA